MASGETIIINDLLSFLSNKLHILSKEDIIKAITGFYPKAEIQDAFTTLISSLPIKPSTKAGLQGKKSNPVLSMYECVVLIPKADLPVFACKNLDNVPRTDQVSVPNLNDPSNQNFLTFKEEHNNMRQQIDEIGSIVNQLNGQLQILLDTTYLMFDESPVKRRKLEILRKKTPDQVPMPKKQLRGLAYLQKLIDEENVEEKGAKSQISGTIIQSSENIDDMPVLENYVEECVVPHEPRTILLEQDSSSDLTKHLSDVIFEANPDGIGCSEITSETVLDDEPNLTQCCICCKVFDFSSDLEDHMKTHLAQAKIPCVFCGMVFSNQDDVKDHFRQCFKDAKAKVAEGTPCTTCGFIFADPEDLTEHQSVHSGTKPYFCRHCTYRFSSQKVLDIHSGKRHSEECAFVCPLCNQMFGVLAELGIHVKLHTGIKTKPGRISSPNKGLVYNAWGVLQDGKPKKNKKTPVNCPTCKKSIPAQEYSAHRLTHRNEKKHTCPHCPYFASTLGYLKVHMRTHSPKDPITCPECLNTFKTKQALMSHVRIHRKT